MYKGETSYLSHKKWGNRTTAKTKIKHHKAPSNETKGAHSTKK